jgi:hypothetical protein
MVCDRQAIGETLALHGHVFGPGQLDRLGEIFTSEAFQSGALKLGAGNPAAHHVTNIVITSQESKDSNPAPNRHISA